MIKPFVPKDNLELPDSYKIKVIYVSGKTDEIEVASHNIRDKVIIPVDQNTNRYEASGCPFLEYVTKDDFWGWIPLSSIQRLEFDKNFSKIIAEVQKQNNKKQTDGK